jgi:hypothetical protein
MTLLRMIKLRRIVRAPAITPLPFNQHPARPRREAERGQTMIRVVIDTVLFSCMGAVVTAIVVAAKTLLS